MENKNRNLVIALPIIISIFLVVGIVIGIYMSQDQNVQQKLLVYPRADKLNNVLNYIEHEYVDTISKDNIVENIIPGILENLDPHSVYIPAKELEKYNEPLQGNFSGIGVQFNMQNDTVIIINTIPNGPSERVGIFAGDRIVIVDEEIVAGIEMPSDSIVKRLRGEKGTHVTVGIKRPGVDNLIDFEITRDDIPLYSVDVAYMINEDIGYMKISKFARTTFEEFLIAIDTLKKQSMKKLIIDLRGNGGGYMDAAINIADQFLTDKKLIVYTQGRSKPRRNFYSTQNGVCLDLQTVILIDEWSASASEILAGALQDNDRGLIIGRRSFGKGLVQEQTRFADGSAIRLTIARYYTPTGRSIQRPYENGSLDYYSEISQRYHNGEFLQKDSIHFNDSLKYTTPGGKTVYGGGGIMPDIFVPADTNSITDYFIDVRNKGLIYRYAFQYTDLNREKLTEFTNYNDLANHIDRQYLLYKFVDFAKEKGVRPNYKEITISTDILKTQIKANIVRNIFDNNGFYPIIRELDNTLNQAIEELKANN